MTDLEQLRYIGRRLELQPVLDAADEIERMNVAHKELLVEREIKNEQIASLRDENERLTAVLQEIAGHEPFIGGDGWIMRNRARIALNTQEQK